MIRDAPRTPPTSLAPPTLRPPEVPPSTRAGDASHSRGLPPVAELGRVNGLREPDQGLLDAEGRGAEASSTAGKVVPEARVRPPSVIMRPPSRGPRFPAPLLSPWRQYALSASPPPPFCSSRLKFVLHSGQSSIVGQFEVLATTTMLARWVSLQSTATSLKLYS
jgi:hypothetical protein